MTKEEFDESKVKRDKLGQFAKMSAKQISETIKEEIGEHKYIEAVDERVPHNSLTDNQWRVWYNEQTQREKGYLLEEYAERRFVDVEGIFVLTNGTFSQPKVEAIYNFEEDKESKEFINILENKYAKHNKTSDERFNR